MILDPKKLSTLKELLPRGAIYGIARKTGIKWYTVSLILNGKADKSRHTATVIEEALRIVREKKAKEESLRAEAKKLL